MRIIVTTKLLENKYIEMREHNLFKVPLKVIYCQDKNYKVHDHIGDSYTTLTLEEQKKGVVVNTLKSKFYPYAYYRMYKFLFKPKGIIENMILGDKKVIYKGNKAIIIENTNLDQKGGELA